MITEKQYKKAKDIVETYELAKWKNDKEKQKKKNKSLVGTFWVYKDCCYSCPQTSKDYWDIFLAVIGVDKNDDMIVVEIQKDSYGKISITQETHSSGFSTSWVRISEKVFLSGINEILGNFSSVAKTWLV